MTKLFHGGYVYNSQLKKFIKSDLLVSGTAFSALIEDGASLESDPDQIIDCEGKYIIPGLVDVHTHGRAGFDFNTAKPDDIKTMRRSYAMRGTTTVMATLASSPMESLVKSSEYINAQRNPLPSLAAIAGIHLEGRYLNPEKRGAHNENLLAKLDADELSYLIEKMLPAPLHISAALELDDGSFAKCALSYGATLGMAHSNATYEQALVAVKNGVTSFTHTFNAMRNIHHREPGNAAASLLCDNAYSEIICDGEHVHPAMISMLQRLKPSDKIVLITDSMEAAGCSDGTYSIAGLEVHVKNGRAVNTDGALAGSTLDMFSALINYMSFCSLTLEEALPAATLNPASMVGISDICGQIIPGARADLIVIKNKNSPEIEMVFAAGGLVS